MKRRKNLYTLGLLYLLVLAGVLFTAIGSNRAVTTAAQQEILSTRHCVIIDAGHGGEDGGAISCSGAYESHINLDIALRLDDLMHLLGIDTKMIRTDDRSIYTQGTTLSAKKISDLKERVRIVNSTPNALLLSIHQNQFPQSQYRGAQIFHTGTSDSMALAATLQQCFQNTLSKENHRPLKKASGVYLMEKVTCTAVLVECGFLSNPQEEALLRSEDYQKKLSCVLAAGCASYLGDLS